ncbi:hypothetical protein B0H66DRAFT_528756 [Apodospora peruviana]|uniref:Uncharacterized protein n=1 Tax=Apodospora peruviana TaxID=516989 RepID=A0AAE0IUJ8_9PEZI|nr:hypothetical protein B0H66DRAFT_528756 [Apodospora peruviana]
MEKRRIEPLVLPTTGGSTEIHESIIKGELTVGLPNGTTESYFLKLYPVDTEHARQVCEGEFESLKAIHGVSPSFAPKAHGWSRLSVVGSDNSADDCEGYFLLTEFHAIAAQPAGPTSLGRRLYSLTYNMVNVIHNSASIQKHVFYDDMVTL